ncbi:MAG: hypothetical protein ACI4M9_05440 [Succinivibrio sp.]
MSMPERYHPECPPDAHKVIRPPVTEVKALLCVAVPDSEESNGMDNVTDILSLMSKEPYILCSDKMKDLILGSAEQAEIKPAFVKILDDKKSASIVYTDGAIGQTLPFYNFADSYQDIAKFPELLKEKCLINLDMMSMFTLRSISTVYPWDELLAKHFLTQFETASANLSEADKKLLCDVRYGRFDALKVEEESKTAYQFLRLERKLFLQYPTEDD